MGSSATYGMTWPVALRLGRVSNLPTVWTNVLAGIVLSRATPNAGIVVALMAVLSLFYIGGMYLNDAFDAGFDRLHRPLRPIPSGAVAASTVFGLGSGFLLAGLVALVGLGLVPDGTGLRAFGTGLLLCIAILVYDAWHKNNPLGPVVMGFCRVLVYATAAIAVSPTLPSALWVDALMALSYLIGLTYAAKQEDLTQPGHWWPLLFLAGPFVVLLPAALGNGLTFLMYVLCLATVAAAMTFMVRRRTLTMGGIVALLIGGISLLDGLFIASQGHGLLALLTIPAFGLTLLLQRHVAGT